MEKQKATWGVCASGITEGEHEYRDHCSTCAPFWWNVPRCPVHDYKLTTNGYCRECKKHYDLTR